MNRSATTPVGTLDDEEDSMGKYGGLLADIAVIAAVIGIISLAVGLAAT